MATEKVSVSLDADILAEARRLSGGTGNLSGYVNDALRRQVLRDQQLEYLAEQDERFGPIPPEEKEAARIWWQEITERLR